MVTINQLIIHKKEKKKKYNKTPLLEKCPHKKGICVRVLIRTPKKPNSAKRKIVKIRFKSKKRRTFAYIPGIGHSLQEYSVVLIRGGRVQDLPGVKYRLVRGKFDLVGVEGRTTARSKYGVPKKRD